MRKSLFTSISIMGNLLLYLIFCGNTYAYTPDSSKQLVFQNLFPEGLNIQYSAPSSIDLTYGMHSCNLVPFMLNEQQMLKPTIKSLGLPNQAGAPDLPSTAAYIAIPNGAKAELIMNNREYVSYAGVQIAPAMQIPTESGNEPLRHHFDPAIYGKNEFYPKTPIQLSSSINMRGLEVLVLNVCPFQYNPVSKELRVYKDLSFQVKWDEHLNTYGDARLMSPFFDALLKQRLLNAEVLEKCPVAKANNALDNEGADYLIIIPNSPEFRPWADSLARFRQRQGIQTRVVTLNDIGSYDANAIEAYIDEAYHTWSPAPSGILLIGDYGVDPDYFILAKTFEDYCVSDLFYADVDEDGFAEMAISRIPVSKGEDLKVVINKIIDYERNPPQNKSYYEQPITAMGWQDERWFQLCSEVVYGFMKEELNKKPIREHAVYSGKLDTLWSTADNTNLVVDYFGPKGLKYIAKTPNELDDFGGNAHRIAQDINRGTFMIQHRDHGAVDGWGEPDFRNEHIDKLQNKNLSFIFSVNCLTGKFNADKECFAEKFLKHTHGAYGLIAASEVSFSFVNDVYVWGLYDYLWDEFIPENGTSRYRTKRPAFANVSAKFFLNLSNWPFNMEAKMVTNYLLHNFGGTFSSMYTEMPEQIVNEYASTLHANQDYVQIQAEKNTVICISKDDQILASVMSTGGMMQLRIPEQLPGTLLDVVLTKQDRFRHEGHIQVISAAGPYCIYVSHQIHEKGQYVNNIVDYDDQLSLNINLQNAGVDASGPLKISLREESPSGYIEIINNQAVCEGIQARSTLDLNDIFEIQVSTHIPDGFELKFILEVQDEELSWSSTFSEIAHAPIIGFGQAIIDDSESVLPNGLIDAGESLSINLPLIHQSFSQARDIKIRLASSSTFASFEEDQWAVDQLNSGEEYLIKVPIQIDDLTQLGSQLGIFVDVQTAAYTFTHFYGLKVGQYVENWENVAAFDWDYDDLHPWTLNKEFPYDGKFHLKSGKIGNKEESNMDLYLSTMGGDSISFYRKVSSEEDDDFLYFYIDDALYGKWSGNNEAYTKETFPVSEGLHHFAWIYKKGMSNKNGGDCAWIDLIEFPPTLQAGVFAGFDQDYCGKSSFHCQAFATAYKSLQWESSGTGYFEQVDALETDYFASEQDITAGGVRLSLRLVDYQNQEHISDFELDLGSPGIPNLDGPTDVDSFYEAESHYFSEAFGDKTISISPEEAATAEVVSDGVNLKWNPDYVGELFLKIQNENACGLSDWSEVLKIQLRNTIGIEDVFSSYWTLYPNPSRGKFILEQKNLTHQETVEIYIYDVKGQLIQSYSMGEDEGRIYIDLSSQKPAVYFLKIKSKTAVLRKKIIIQE